MEKDFSIEVSSPVGPVQVWANESGVSRVVLAGLGDQAAVSASIALGRHRLDLEQADDPKAKQHLAAAKSWLFEYFSSDSEPEMPELNISGTEFQRSVWREISKLERGETTTYGEIASKIGRPAAIRAVGGAVGANPVPLLIGCHRVLGHNGRITGYSGGDGLDTKRLLLKLEGIEYRD